MVIPQQGEGNPFFTVVDDVRREDGDVIQMKLEKSKILATESVLHQLLQEMIGLAKGEARNLKTTEMLRLVQMTRQAAEELLLLGLALPVGANDCQPQDTENGSCINLDLAVLDSNELLKRKIGFVFNVRKETEKLIEVANLSQARKREKELAIHELTQSLDDHLAKCHVIMHLKDQQLNLIRLHFSELHQHV